MNPYLNTLLPKQKAQVADAEIRAAIEGEPCCWINLTIADGYVAEAWPTGHEWQYKDPDCELDVSSLDEAIRCMVSAWLLYWGKVAYGPNYMI